MAMKRLIRRKAITFFFLALLGVGVAVPSLLAQSAPVRIMPLGDSLTSSIDGQASYRYWLWQKLIAGGYSVDFVGTLWGVGDGVSGIYPDFDQDHEGHSGATTDDILNGLPDWAARDQADIVLLIIGSNDFDQGRSVAHAVSNTRKIIKTLRAANPNVAVLLGLLPPQRTQNGKIQAYNSSIVSQAPSWSQRKSPVRIVNLWSDFSVSKDTLDGDHPSVSGEKKIANRFYRRLTQLLMH